MRDMHSFRRTQVDPPESGNTDDLPSKLFPPRNFITAFDLLISAGENKEI